MADVGMRIQVTVKPTWRDLRGRFSKAEQALLDARRDELRELGQEAVAFLRDEAPKGQTGEFARKIGFRTYQRGDTLGFSTHMPQPLGKWIVHGTDPHVITPKGAGYPLRFFWPRLGRTVFFYSVNHPGTQANPFVDRAYRRWKPGAQAALYRMATRYAATVSG